jgi:HSP20 family protein
MLFPVLRREERRKVMGTIAVHKENGHTEAKAQIAQEPKKMRPLERLLSFDPFERMWPLAESARTFAPAFEIKDTKDACVFHADLPGVKDGDVEVTLSGNILCVTGKRHEVEVESGEHFYARECAYGEFARTFSLPETLDTSNIYAHMRDGVLTISIKKKPEVETKKIPIATPESEKP